jgi:acyl-CoA reductase-like NAD-dependent aldehyde dehydrogenase
MGSVAPSGPRTSPSKHLDFGPNVPFGGCKRSGIGVEFAEEGFHEFTQVRVINQAK